ncbi:asparagine synthase (glutamine-hydrolyzing) [Nocardia terpenica]|uniref:asparagine synthase (glutamine-hydrolyzing) n=1 Tax=Nocardia terpenica TaxID=455432 RepID=A0A6G9Z9J4_9NOCA|nr:asparagine synthase (glutamine-hydrolyzing) [Nocardia terpenica]QIS22134.1 asparagine synthase (glutamine-hydrolyzing) [Nocardia terpenica]
MCGITGWVSFHRDLTSHRDILDAMTRTQEYRGPDAGGVWLSQHAGLGHRRLAVIDIEGGKQPMIVETPHGSVAMTYSGEIYNYVELRGELRRRGHKFRTSSDTEVVLQAYLEWGEGLVEHLNGMYAFAIWDDRIERLVLVRDRMGIKPLYRYPTEDGILFGSEPKAILANPLVEPIVNTDGLRELFSFSKTPGHAIWAGMLEVLPGTVVTVDRSGTKETVYWRLGAVEHSDDIDTTVHRVRALLDDTLERQLVADVPRCVLLSGGLDSSAITALSAPKLAERNEKLRSFAVDFIGQTENFKADEFHQSPDSPFVHDVARHVGTEHRDILLDPGMLSDPEVRRAVVEARDRPFGFGDMDNSLYLLFKAIREHSTVALSGEAADEIFGGYIWFHHPGLQMADTFPWVAAVRADPSAHPTALFSPELASSKLDLLGYVHDCYTDALAEVPMFGDADGHERRMRQSCYLHLTRFMRLLLDRKDRLSMAAGLEVRVPFCDHRIVEYVFNTSWAAKTFDGREKSLLRAAVRDVIPRSVAERPKAMFPSTQNREYMIDLQNQVEDLFSAGHQSLEFFDRTAVREVVGCAPERIRMDQRMAVERLLELAVWLDSYRPTLKIS